MTESTSNVRNRQHPPGRPVEYSPAAFAEAKAREQEFLERILPAVLKSIRCRFWDYGHHDREDLLQEGAGIAWKMFVAFCHHHPGEGIGDGWITCIRRWVWKMLWKWVRLCGADRGTDVLSFRCRLKHGVRVGHDYRAVRYHTILLSR